MLGGNDQLSRFEPTKLLQIDDEVVLRVAGIVKVVTLKPGWQQRGIDSARHANYVDVETYLKVLADVVEQLESLDAGARSDGAAPAPAELVGAGR